MIDDHKPAEIRGNLVLECADTRIHCKNFKLIPSQRREIHDSQDGATVCDVMFIEVEVRSMIVLYRRDSCGHVKTYSTTCTLVFCSYTPHHIMHLLPAECPTAFYHAQ